MPLPVGRRIRVTGIVQGVGFRPFVHHLAAVHGLLGDVANTGQGVDIRVFGAAAAVDRLVAALREEAPPLARLDTVSVAEIPWEERQGFAILASEAGVQRHVAVAPDAAI
jgi:hydrogenase maturation protein HypF